MLGHMIMYRDIAIFSLYILACLCSLHHHVESADVERHFYHHIGCSDYFREHNITLSRSSYFTHRLVTEIVKQLLSDRLGYKSIRYELNSTEVDPPTNCSHNVKFHDCNDVRSIAANRSDGPCVELALPPEPVVGIQSSAQLVSTEYTDVGSLGLTTRYGFYMSRSILNIENIQHTDVTEYTIISQLTTNNTQIMKTVEEQRTSGSSLDFSSHSCVDNSCPILLVGSIDITADSLKQQLERLELSLRVVYVGDALASVVYNLTEHNIAVLFFTRAPDLLTISTAFTEIRSLRDVDSCAAYYCPFNYPVIELRKLVWSTFIQQEPLIYQLIKNIRLSDSIVLALLSHYKQRYSSSVAESNITEFISGWIHNNSQLVDDWVPESASRKPQLVIGGFFPLNENGAWREPSLVPAAQFAIDKVNKDSTVLQNYRLSLLVNDTHCDSAYVLKTFTEYIRNETVWSTMVGGLGPACADSALDLAALTTHYNYVLVSYAVDSVVLSLDRARYRYFYRTVPQINEYAKVYVSLFQRLKWTKSLVSMLTDDSSGEFPVYHRMMSEEFKQQNITLAYQEILPRKQYLENDGIDAYGKYLEEIKAKQSRIIIMDVYEDVARNIMCQAFHKNMTMQHGYVWFLPDTLNWRWYDPKRRPQKNVPCTLEQMTKAVRGYFSLAHSNIDKSNNIAVGNMTGTEFEAQYEAIVRNHTDRMYPSEYGSYAYDAVWTFAKAIDLLHAKEPAYLKYMHTLYVVEEYKKMLNQTQFQGVSGNISFNENGDRSGITDIRQHNDTNKNDKFLKATVIGNWSNGVLYLDMDMIEWGPKMSEETTTSTPPFCEWEKLRVFLRMKSCYQALLAVVVPTCCFVILVIILGAMCALKAAKKKYRLAAELASKFGEGAGFGAFGGFLSLDDKEILRDHVVLNRKLGEGAFGTVYGGEAYINSTWTGVAVKTLKVGSNSEEKLDFLREADIMKRFDHKNIVKLLGVTTRGEPAYAIMEFMLYGDLKTYLLSRRELVGMDTKETEDISAASLTRMAIDVIEGLNYLHNKEYIHRDIACRNCLISASRTVKIGDFGMTRRVYDDGSYIFTKRGRLPVRWMAPESFIDGVFTYKTDLWSYGVLLYEIITFGSIPYHMLTNAEVFEGVKAGKTLTLPEECTDELKSLLLGCWHNDPSHRPNPLDIYVMLTNNENMIQPLLSCPALAKIRECDSVELDLSPTFIKTSTLLKKPFLRQSSSVISVDTGVSSFSRHRNHSEISYRRSVSHRRRSSHSIIDLFSLVNPLSNPPPATPMSLPSPSHSTDHPSAATFQFNIDNRQSGAELPPSADVKPLHIRTKHNSGSAGTSVQPIITENDYLLTTRSCTDIDDRSNHSHTPLIHKEETVI